MMYVIRTRFKSLLQRIAMLDLNQRNCMKNANQVNHMGMYDVINVE